MATSGSTDFSVSRTNIIEEAYRIAGVLDDTASASSAQLTTGALSLNMLVKAWHADGMPLWAIKSKAMTLTASTNSYTVSTLSISRPLRVIQAFSRDTSVTPNLDTPMEIITRDEYLRLSSKASTGTPNVLYYDPQLTDALATVYLWPTPDSTVATNKQVIFYYQRPFEDFDAAADTPDFPQEWYNAIVWNLALVLAHKAGVPDYRLDRIEKRAELEHMRVKEMGHEEGTITFVPDPRMYWKN